jgi:hypothetical protein
MFRNVLAGVDGRPTGWDAIALARRVVDPDGVLTDAHPRLLRNSLEECEAQYEDERRVAGIDPGYVRLAPRPWTNARCAA